MQSLFEQQEEISSAPPIVGYRILKLIEEKKSGKVSMFDIAEKFKSERWFSIRRLYMGMIFLYSLGLIEFEQPYIIKNA